MVIYYIGGGERGLRNSDMPEHLRAARDCAFGIPYRQSLKGESLSPPLGSNMNSENEFVLFFSIDYGRQKYCSHKGIYRKQIKVG